MNGTRIIMTSAFDLEERMLADLKAKECIAGEMKKPASPQ
jgi:hypothetical protein